MPIYSMVHYIIIGESASINGSKYLMLCFIFILIVDKIKTSNLHKTSLNFLF